MQDRAHHPTPWANDAFSKLLKHGAGLAAVLPQVGVLLVFATVALLVATWRLWRTLTAPVSARDRSFPHRKAAAC
jgi:hypothetical protein